MTLSEPVDLYFTDEEFYSIMDDAMDSIPDDLFKRIRNVQFFMEHEPDRSQKALCRSARFDLLGLYTGVSLPNRASNDGAWMTPDRIWVFKRPIERLSYDRASCQELIRVTLLHEIGHYFGMNDDELMRLGY